MNTIRRHKGKVYERNKRNPELSWSTLFFQALPYTKRFDHVERSLFSRLCTILSNSLLSIFTISLFLNKRYTFRSVLFECTRIDGSNVATQEYRTKPSVFRIERKEENMTRSFSLESVRWKPSIQLVQILGII